MRSLLNLRHSGSRLVALIICLLLPVGAQAAVIIQYHHISDDTPRATSTSPALFKKHMAHIEKQGYEVVPLEELLQCLRSGEELPDKTVAITFDDGYDSIYDKAFPVLKRYGFPFTVFVNTKPLEQGLDQFMTWDQLRDMAEAGATIANHTYSHPHLLRRLDGESEGDWRDRIREEVTRAQKRIRKEIGQNHKLFAYPYGEYDPTVREIMADLGYMAFGQQSGPLASYSDPQALPRFPFGGSYGEMEDFRVKVASLPLPIEEMAVYDSKGKVIESSLLPQSEDRPKLKLQLEPASLHQRVQCFASGQGAIQVTATEEALFARANRPLPVGRSRYNCTASSGEAGRFYWYSEFFIRKKPDGSWYAEP